MVWFWRYLIGYVSIKIIGENAEQILNKAAANGISIWNLTYKNGIIFGNITLKDFLKLRITKRNTKCKISIINKYGLFFYLKKYKTRIGFASGIAIFVFILVFLSNYIWIINVEGNKSLKTEEILTSCKKIGIYEGVRKTKISNKYDSQKLQLTQKELSWCALNIEGSVLTINVSEAIKSDKEERKMPTNLKANIDGKIKKIDASSGSVIVKVGDIVTKGDLLVSGVVPRTSSTVFIHSDGEIIAETKRVFTASGEYKQSKIYETGNNAKRYTISCFNIIFPLYLSNVNTTYNYDKTIKNATLFNKNLPIKIMVENYKEISKRNVIYNKETLENILYNDIKNQVKKFNLISAKEFDRETTYTDKGMLLKITYDCVENIAVQDEILLSKVN